VARIRQTTIRAMRMRSEVVIQPLAGDLRASMPMINATPDTCPASKRRPFDVPSGTG
jgi:hypothetical protein